MTKKQAIKLAGTASELSRILGVSRQSVNQWPGPKLPELMAYRLKDARPAWFLPKAVA